MPSPPVVDFDRLLTPIPGENPAGVDLREDSTPNSLYYQIKDARSSARAAERLQLTAENAAEVKVDWKPVLEKAPMALAERSKDVEILAYYIEALVRKHGFAGLRDGFKLAKEMCQQFWDHLYPLPDEDGIETRISPLVGLNGDDAEGTLIAPLESVLITQGTGFGPFAYWHYKQAGDLESLDPERREKRIEQGAVPMEKIDRAVAETDPSFFLVHYEDLNQAWDEYFELDAFLQEKCGPDAPPTSNIRSTIDAIRTTIKTIGGIGLETEGEGEGGEGGGGGLGGRGASAGNREEALRQLREVAEFFRRTEPHSPISYLLDQAVRWAKLPLPDLLTELIPDSGSRDQLFKLVGIRLPD